MAAIAVAASLGGAPAEAGAGAAPSRHSLDGASSGRRVAGRKGRATGSEAAGSPVGPSEFEPGACVAFAPTHGDNHHTVFLDAGHGNIDPGGQGATATGTVVYEAPSDLAITLDTAQLLRAHGFRVVVSRAKATEVARLTATDMTGTVLSPQGALADLAARDQCADLASATLLVGIYLDASATPLNAGSVTAYDAQRPFAAKSLELATLLQTDVLAHLNAHGWQIPNDGVQTDTTLGGTPLTTTAASYHHLVLLGPALPGWFTTPSTMPGALIEPLYISDPFEGSIAVSSTGRGAIAAGIAQAAEQYFGPGVGEAGGAAPHKKG